MALSDTQLAFLAKVGTDLEATCLANPVEGGLLAAGAIEVLIDEVRQLHTPPTEHDEATIARMNADQARHALVSVTGQVRHLQRQLREMFASLQCPDEAGVYIVGWTPGEDGQPATPLVVRMTAAQAEESGR